MAYLPAFERDGNRFTSKSKIGTQAHLDLLYCVGEVRQTGITQLVLDFSECPGAFSNGMVPILCTVDQLRADGVKVDFLPPRDSYLARLFQNTNWAHFLCPEKYRKSDSTFDRHLATQHFQDAGEQQAAVNGLLDVILRTIDVPREQLQALEWSLNGQDAVYRASSQKLRDVLKLLFDRGIRLVPGTDDVPGVVLHSELEEWQRAGIPPKDVLRLATIGSAEHLGLDRELGTIARGKRADLLLVPGDPTQNVSVLRKVRLVMKDGAVFFPDEVHTAIGVLPFASRPVVQDSIVP